MLLSKANGEYCVSSSSPIDIDKVIQKQVIVVSRLAITSNQLHVMPPLFHYNALET